MILIAAWIIAGLVIIAYTFIDDAKALVAGTNKQRDRKQINRNAQKPRRAKATTMTDQERIVNALDIYN